MLCNLQRQVPNTYSLRQDTDILFDTETLRVSVTTFQHHIKESVGISVYNIAIYDTIVYTNITQTLRFHSLEDIAESAESLSA